MSGQSTDGTDHVVLNLTKSEAQVLETELVSIANGGGWKNVEASASDIRQKLLPQLHGGKSSTDTDREVER